jgi:hypothetical protein
VEAISISISSSKAIDMAMAPTTKVNGSDRSDRKQAFYRLEKIAAAESRDTDQDGLSDVDELNYPGVLNPLEPDDADLDFDSDGKTNKQELTALFSAGDPGGCGV